MQYIHDIYINGPDADDRYDGFNKTEHGQLFWNDPTGKSESVIYDPKKRSWRKMTDEEHGRHNNGELV